MKIAVPSQDDPRMMLELELPGDVVVKVPRFDFISEDEIDAIQVELDAIDGDLPAHRQQRLGILVHFNRFCTPEQQEVVAGLALGQLRFMMDTWTEQSSLSLGEYMVSGESSTETQAKQSSRTSSRKGGGD
jgi:hypothetical protein